jgi:hypothetical protein
MKKTQALKKVIASEVKSVLKEDYARGIPDWALSDAVNAASNELRRYLLLSINQTSSNSGMKRDRIVAANEVLRKLEKDMKDLLEDKLMEFMRST